MRYCKIKRVTALCLLEEPIDEKEWISLDVEQHRKRFDRCFYQQLLYNKHRRYDELLIYRACEVEHTSPVASAPILPRLQTLHKLPACSTTKCAPQVGHKQSFVPL